jgi:tRNA 2-thiouridine synthesizing protein A
MLSAERGDLSGHPFRRTKKELRVMPEQTEITVDKEIDARGSFCPGPLMELIRGMKALPVGGTLAVLSSDPGSAKDIPAWIQKARHEFLGAFPAQGYTRFVARKTH